MVVMHQEDLIIDNWYYYSEVSRPLLLKYCGVTSDHMYSFAAHTGMAPHVPGDFSHSVVLDHASVTMITPAE